jgi:hypothetical protein
MSGPAITLTASHPHHGSGRGLRAHQAMRPMAGQSMRVTSCSRPMPSSVPALQVRRRAATAMPLFGDRSVASRVSGGRARARRDRRARVLAACALRVSRYRCALRAETSSRLSPIYVSRRLTNTCWANFVSLIEGQLVLRMSASIGRTPLSAIRPPGTQQFETLLAATAGGRWRWLVAGAPVVAARATSGVG